MGAAAAQGFDFQGEGLQQLPPHSSDGFPSPQLTGASDYPLHTDGEPHEQGPESGQGQGQGQGLSVELGDSPSLPALHPSSPPAHYQMELASIFGASPRSAGSGLVWALPGAITPSSVRPSRLNTPTPAKDRITTIPMPPSEWGWGIGGAEVGAQEQEQAQDSTPAWLKRMAARAAVAKQVCLGSVWGWRCRFQTRFSVQGNKSSQGETVLPQRHPLRTNLYDLGLAQANTFTPSLKPTHFSMVACVV